MVQNNFKKRGEIPKFSDLEMIALRLTVGSLGTARENYLFTTNLFAELSMHYAN